MLDMKSNLVLKILQRECPNGSYHIVESKDIISALPNKYRVDADALDNILTYLERQELISIKYDDDGVYCLCLLPYGSELLENERQQKREGKKPSPLWIFILIGFLSSLVGSFIGAILASTLG